MKRWWIAGVALALLFAPAGAATARERTIPLPGPPTDVYVYGSVWVTTVSPELLLRLAPASGRVLARIPVPTSPYSQIAIADGSVWVTDSASGALYRVDPRTRRIVATIRLHAPALGIAVDAGSLWVTAPAQAHGTVFRIDPATNRVVKRLRTGTGPGPIVSGGGWIWLIDTSFPYAGLQAIDPTTDRVASKLALRVGGDGAVALAGTNRYLWLGDRPTNVERYDTYTGKPAASIPARASYAVGAYGRVAFGVGPHTATQLSAHGDRVGPTFEVGATPVAVGVGPRFAWVANYEDSTLTRIAYR